VTFSISPRHRARFQTAHDARLHGHGASHGKPKKHRSPGSVGPVCDPLALLPRTAHGRRSCCEMVTTLNLAGVRNRCRQRLFCLCAALCPPSVAPVIIPMQ